MPTQYQSPAIRVVLADGQPRLACDALASMIAQAPDLDVVGHVTTHLDLVEHVVALQPAVVVLDVCLLLCTRDDILHHLITRAPEVRIVMLLPEVTDQAVQAALQAGATSIVLRSTSGETMIQVIRAAARGDGLYPQEVVGSVYHAIPTLHRILALPAEAECLTARQREIFYLLTQGHSNQAIADELSITPDAVKKHRKRIQAKLHGASHSYAGFVCAHPQRQAGMVFQLVDNDRDHH